MARGAPLRLRSEQPKISDPAGLLRSGNATPRRLAPARETSPPRSVRERLRPRLGGRPCRKAQEGDAVMGGVLRLISSGAMTYAPTSRMAGLCSTAASPHFSPRTAKAHDRPAMTSLRLLAVLTVLSKGASARRAARALSCSEKTAAGLGQPTAQPCATTVVAEAPPSLPHPGTQCRQEWRHGTQECVHHVNKWSA